MKHPIECTKQELVAVVSGIQCALYLDDGVWNPDKDWSPDTLDKKNRMAGRDGSNPMQQRKVHVRVRLDKG
jgi:hypothetical protein